MLETISQGFQSAKQLLAGQRALTESNIEEALQKVRLSLLEADVEYGVVTRFLTAVKNKVLGKAVDTVTHTKEGQKLRLSPAEHFIGICFEELKALMGPVDTSIRLPKPIATIMMVGLQGSGKTTTTGKLASLLLKKSRRPLLVAADIYRPAAVKQLQILGEQLNVPVFTQEGILPPALCKAALQQAKQLQCDVVIFDTAGRLAIDEPLMQELESIQALTKPDNIFLVVDAMIGQDAVHTAAEFNKRLNVDGFILTKLDGDARGGAALSIKEVTSKPIKFLGQGEKLNALEEFRPEGLASRILGMGDIVSLVKDFEEHMDHAKAEKDAKRILKGQLTLQDFLEQLRLIKKMGSLQSIMEKLPGMNEMLPPGGVNEKELTVAESIMLSMTKLERENPAIITKQRNRMKRIAKGSGRREKDIESLLSRFNMMKQVMGMVNTQPGLLGRLPGFRQLGQMAQMSKAYQGMGGMPQMPQMSMMQPGGFRAAAVTPKSKDSKQKRKAQKLARKKSKKK